MTDIITYNQIEDRIITLRNKPVLIDRDVAAHYEVETRDINKAVRNNPDKFPDNSYVFELQNTENQQLVENFHRFDKLKHSTVSPKAFTKKGIYTCLPPY